MEYRNIVKPKITDNEMKRTTYIIIALAICFATSCSTKSDYEIERAEFAAEQAKLAKNERNLRRNIMNFARNTKNFAKSTTVKRRNFREP